MSRLNILVRQGDEAGLAAWLAAHPPTSPETHTSRVRQYALTLAVSSRQPGCVALLLDAGVQDSQGAASQQALEISDEDSLRRLWPTLGEDDVSRRIAVAAIGSSVRMSVLADMLTDIMATAPDGHCLQMDLWYRAASAGRVDVLAWLADRQPYLDVFEVLLRDEQWSYANLVHQAVDGRMPDNYEDVALRRAPPGSFPSIISSRERRLLEATIPKAAETPDGPSVSPRSRARI